MISGNILFEKKTVINHFPLKILPYQSIAGICNLHVALLPLHYGTFIKEKSKSTTKQSIGINNTTGIKAHTD